MKPMKLGGISTSWNQHKNTRISKKTKASLTSDIVVEVSIGFSLPIAKWMMLSLFG
jgi:hypothetical protein